jgi:predicted HicB family RNase H-like nuclease
MKLHGYFVTDTYKGFHGRADYDADDDLYHGELLGIRDVITFVGHAPRELQRAFQDSVDDYLAWCKERRKKPNKPFSGTFLVRATEELHRRLSVAAEENGKSLNSVVVETLEAAFAKTPKRRPRRAAM